MSQQAQVVILGQLGCGKTTLLNKICNTTEQTGYGGHSMTRYVFSRQAAYGTGFKILDTPGFGSDRERLAHAAGIVAALQEGPVNRILIAVKYERIALMKEAIKTILLPIKKYKDLITFVFTCWDLSQNKKQDEELLEDILNYFHIHSYILSGKETNGEYLCKEIERELNSYKVQITISDSEFQTSFEILEDDQKDFDMLADIENYSTEFKKCVEAVRQFIIAYDNNKPELDQVMHSLTIWIKQLAEDSVSQFEQKNAKKMDQIFNETGDAFRAYLYQIELKKSIQDKLNQVVILAQNKMKYKPDHPFNYIKQCPYPDCRIIWIKEEGCDGRTTCGNYPTQKSSLFGNATQFLKTTFRYDQQTKTLSMQSTTQNIQPSQLQNNTKLSASKKGCGRQIFWSSLPPLTKAQIDVLVDPGILDFLADKRGQKKEESLYLIFTNPKSGVQLQRLNYKRNENQYSFAYYCLKIFNYKQLSELLNTMLNLILLAQIIVDRLRALIQSDVLGNVSLHLQRIAKLPGQCSPKSQQISYILALLSGLN